MAGLSLNCVQNYTLYYTCATYTPFFWFFFVSGFLGWLTIGPLGALGMIGGCKGWGRPQRLWLGRFPVVMLTLSLRSVASITTGYSEATLRVGGAIGPLGALGAIGGWGIRDGMLYYIMCGRVAEI